MSGGTYDLKRLPGETAPGSGGDESGMRSGETGAGSTLGVSPAATCSSFGFGGATGTGGATGDGTASRVPGRDGGCRYSRRRKTRATSAATSPTSAASRPPSVIESAISSSIKTTSDHFTIHPGKHANALPHDRPAIHADRHPARSGPPRSAPHHVARRRWRRG